MKYLIIFFLTISSVAFAQEAKYKGQAPISNVPITTSRPTIPQWKGIVEVKKGVYFSNDFQGGRLNGIIEGENDTLIAVISAENVPINSSAWYAFKVWSDAPEEVVVKLTYQNGKHRYYPKLSKDGINWSLLDSTKVHEIGKGGEKFGGSSQSEAAVLHLDASSDTLWVAAQELQTSKHVFGWIDEMSKASFISAEEIGKSRQGRPIKCMHIGSGKDKKMILVISRQHPPEVTGYLSMKSFVENLTVDTKLAKKFRKKYDIYVVPLMNPDGVDNGHWRHNIGGIDLNRDWSDFNQPETSAVKDFMHKKTKNGKGKFYFAIDFHSTWDDIYYTLPDTASSNLTGFTTKWLTGVETEIPGYQPNVKPTKRLEPTWVSRNFFFVEFGAEALVFEIGDNTPRDFIKEKAKVSAEQMMKIMLEEYK
ncbi:M14 family metallopeptidase [Flammeovirgaceae bacterium SG7u.111]|nr:M14 family metallopeptidase [Flammeovirgaceae bacterium SG7u.132]WPO37027.1 M14 family metallopeptidase [Flammeovirgaceae bacterium SG7u.111]